MDAIHENLDLLAAEYAIGTLRGPACARFEERLRHDPALALRVRDWEVRLSPLLQDYEPQTGASSAWAGIERRLFGSGKESNSGPVARGIAWWRRAAAGLAFTTVILFASAVYLGREVERPQCYAVLTDAGAAPVAVVFDRNNMRELVVLPIGSRLVSATGHAQLWIVAGGKTLPVGILNPDGETRVALDKSMLTAVMAEQARLMVTLEPTRGIPAATLGEPAGPRVADGAVALFGTAPSPGKSL